MEFLENPLAFLLFSLETYHTLGHCIVLFRFRLLPRKDLVRLRIYFVIDLLTVFISSFLFLQNLRWLAAIQIILHIYYVVFWEKTNPAKKLVSWSSLDWIRSDYQSEWHLETRIGILFDAVVHCTMATYLRLYLTTVQIIGSLALTHCAFYMVFFNPKFAWSNPWSVPKWVEKRIQPVTEDEANWFS